ncbi:hypothetical protein ABKV19_004521 [Rosa sericea]
METLFRVVCSSFPATPPIPHRSLSTRNPSVSALRTGPSPVSELAEEDVLQTFFKERQLNGDFVSRLSDVFWQREFTNFVDGDGVGDIDDTTTQQQAEEQAVNDAGGFLKLSATNEWVLGDRSAPINKKAIAKAMQNDSERTKKLNLLQYEAIQRELMLLSIGIGTACTGYCLITLSFQGAVSYATGVLFSCLYLKLLYQHVDNISREAVPQIFLQKKSKKYKNFFVLFLGLISVNVHCNCQAKSFPLMQNWNKKSGSGGFSREIDKGLWYGSFISKACVTSSNIWIVDPVSSICFQ